VGDIDGTGVRVSEDPRIFDGLGLVVIQVGALAPDEFVAIPPSGDATRGLEQLARKAATTQTVTLKTREGNFTL